MDIRRSAPEESLRGHVKEVFSAFDTDGSGDISVSEFQDLLYTLGEVVDDDAAKASFAAIDTDASGTISFEEFFTWWKNAGIDSGASVRSSGDPTAALQAKLASRNLVRYLANSLTKARSGISDGANKKNEVQLDLTVVAGEITRFAETNSRVHVSLKQNTDAAGITPSLELAFSMLEGSDSSAVDAKIREAIRPVLEMAAAIAPSFADTTHGIRKSADGSKDQYFFKIPLPAVPPQIANMAKMVGFSVNVDLEVKSGAEDAIDALFFHFGGNLSKSLIQIAGNLPLPVPKTLLSTVKNLNRFSTTLDFASFAELAPKTTDGKQKPLLDKKKIAKSLAAKFFVPVESNPFAPLMSEIYYAIQENLKFVELIHVVSAEADIEIKVHAQNEWTFASKFPNRADIEDARPGLKNTVLNMQELQQAPGRPEGEMEGWLPLAEKPEIKVFVRWVDKSKFGKERQSDYQALRAGLKQSEEFFGAMIPDSEIPKVVASGEDDNGVWHCLSWEHDFDWSTNKPSEPTPLTDFSTLDAVRATVGKIARKFDEIHTNNWVLRYITPKNLYIGLTSDRRVVCRFLRADDAIQGPTISAFADPALSSSFDVRPPEAVAFEDYDKSIDVWALGIFAYTLMNKGKEPESTTTGPDGAPAVDLSVLNEVFLNDDTKEFFEKTIAPLATRLPASEAASIPFVSWAPWNLPEPESTEGASN